MINNIIEGISINLKNGFGDTYSIYSGDIKQDLKRPCFFIKALDPSISAKLGNRQYREYPFDIHYYPGEETENSFEMNTVAESLIDILKLIPLKDDLIRGSHMTYQVEDSILHFKVKYNLFVTKQIETDFMESLHTNQTIKRWFYGFKR